MINSDLKYRVETNYESLETHNSVGVKNVEVGKFIDYLGFGCYNLIIQLFSMTMYLTGSAQLTLSSFITSPLKDFWNLSSFESGLIGSSVFLGMSVGSLFWGWVSDVFGRRFSLVLSVTIGFLFALVSSLSKNFYLFLISRVICGMGIGGQNITISLLIEFLPTKSRGFWMLMVHAFWSVGIIGMVLIAWIVFENNLSFFFLGVKFEPYMIFMLLCLYPYPLIFFLLSLSSESTRYNSLQQDRKSIQKTISRMETWNCRKIPSHWNIKCTSDEESTSSFLGLLKPSVIPVLLSSIIMWTLSTLIFFGVTISQPALFSSNKYLGTMISSASEIIGIFIPFPFVCVIGRRELLFFSSSVCGIGLIILSFPSIFLNFFASLGICVVIRASCNCADALMITLVEESIPSESRSSGCALCDFISKMVTIFFPLFFQMIPSVGGNLFVKIFLFFIAFSLGIAGLFHPVESRGKVLQETAV